MLRRLTIFMGFMCVSFASQSVAAPTQTDFLGLARQGWVFELRSSVMRRAPDMPMIRTDSREVASGALCVLGDAPSPIAADILRRFLSMTDQIYGTRRHLSRGVRSVKECGIGHRVYLRFYNGLPPQFMYNRDLRLLDAYFDIGLPRDRDQLVQSPAQATTYFARRGPVSYLLIKQPPDRPLNALEDRFYRSILIEELYQVFTFGMDILVFDRNGAFTSKLQEFPVNLRNFAWTDPRFMEGLVNSNPNGLCAFDVFMMHALAATDEPSANSEAFLAFIEEDFDDLLRRAQKTLADPQFTVLTDPDCRELPGQ